MGRSSAGSPLVLGAEGLVGRTVVRIFEERYPNTVAATRAEIDVTDRFRLETEVERLEPTALINCAAYADVDGCEAHPESARRVNAEGAENVAQVAAAVGCRVVHISTDYVFDGRARRPYTEDDRPAPLSEYGRSKLDGERRVAAAARDHLIVRTSGLFGKGRPTFVDTIRGRAREGGILRVVSDQVGSPTYVSDLAEALSLLLPGDHIGVVHFANAGSCSRFDLAGAILRTIGAPRARLVSISTPQAGRAAPRPAYSALDTALYTRLTGASPRPWEKALTDYLRGSDP